MTEANIRGARGYGKPELIEPGETLETPLIPGLRLDVTEILRRLRP